MHKTTATLSHKKNLVISVGMQKINFVYAHFIGSLLLFSIGRIKLTSWTIKFYLTTIWLIIRL